MNELHGFLLAARVFLLATLSIAAGAYSERPRTEAGPVGFGLFVFGSASHPTTTDGTSSGGNPLIAWRTLQPEEDVYNWAPLDSMVQRALASDTKIVPRIVTNFSVFGQATPDWFFQLLDAQYYFPHARAQTEGYRAPVPWDPIYQEKFASFLRALGERYDGNPAIEFFQITGAGVYGEMYMGSRMPEGYSFEAHKAANAHWIDAWRIAFPTTDLALMVNALGHNIGEEAAAYAVSKGYYLQMNNPIGNPPTRGILEAHQAATKIIIEAENGGCGQATGSKFRELMDTLFDHGFGVDYITLCSQTFADPRTADALTTVWDRLRR